VRNNTSYKLKTMTDPTIDAFFKWASGILLVASGLMVAITRDFGIKQSQVASGWPAFMVGVFMTCAGIAMLASCFRSNRESRYYD
jgi:uncharacterized membrane protein HdeD (DUF308 family)